VARTSRQWIEDTVILALVIAAACLYFVMNNTPTATVHILRSVIDDQIPRLPIFTVPYLAFLPWVWATVSYVWYKNRSFRRLALALIIVNLLACLTYVFYQTAVPRDPVLGDDLFSGILKYIYGHDNIYAGFPSLHAAMSATIATYFVIKKSRWTWAYRLWDRAANNLSGRDAT